MMTVLFYTLFILFILLFPIGVAIAYRHYFNVPWWLFIVGIVTFVGSQVMHIPLNNWLTQLGFITDLSKESSDLWRTALVLGMTAGISETAARAIGFGIIQMKRPLNQKADSLFVGLGHGGIEAMLLGGVLLAATISSLLSLRGANLAELAIPASDLPLLETQLAAIESITITNFVPFFERLIAMTLHIVLSLLVWQAFTKRNWLYAIAALLYHTFVDGTAVYLTQFITNIWLIELCLLLMLLPGLAYLVSQWPKGERQRQNQPSIKHEIKLFGVALNKELLQLWRTKRVLVVWVVFLLFGLGSPLLANLTPQLLQNIEGAEQFSELIPTPTNSDALAQYIRNITQFGFIIAVMLGMGAVAGEKERKTAPIILSKPIPRWTFLLSKFFAQAILYFGAFLIAAMAAYYYTYLLFEPFSLGEFLFGNLLLFVWLMVFSAVTILGSTIAKSTGAAAGISLGGAILLLILGAIPQIGQLMPGGLIGWASQLGIDGLSAPNGGALANNILLIILFLLSAIAIFEVQEL